MSDLDAFLNAHGCRCADGGATLISVDTSDEIAITELCLRKRVPMLTAATLEQVERALTFAVSRCTGNSARMCFGRKSVMAVSDLYQLPAVERALIPDDQVFHSMLCGVPMLGRLSLGALAMPVLEEGVVRLTFAAQGDCIVGVAGVGEDDRWQARASRRAWGIVQGKHRSSTRTATRDRRADFTICRTCPDVVKSGVGKSKLGSLA